MKIVLVLFLISFYIFFGLHYCLYLVDEYKIIGRSKILGVLSFLIWPILGVIIFILMLGRLIFWFILMILVMIKEYLGKF